MDTTLGPYRPYGTMKNTSQKETGRLSLISTWRSPVAGRTFYDTRQSLELDVKLREPGWGPKLLPLLKARCCCMHVQQPVPPPAIACK